MRMFDLALVYLVAINWWTFFRFMQDKDRAIAQVRRIPESELLGLALIGGTPGAFAARKIFRHKTRKQPFSAQLYTTALLQTGLAIAAGFYFG